MALCRLRTLLAGVARGYAECVVLSPFRIVVMVVCAVVLAIFTAVAAARAFGDSDWGWFTFLVAVGACALISMARGARAYRRRVRAERSDSAGL